MNAPELERGFIVMKLNKQQAMELFLKNAILIGNEDQITVRTATIVFGADAVEYVLALPDGAGRYHNSYGFGGIGKDIRYMTLSGCMLAVTYNNVKDEWVDACRSE